MESMLGKQPVQTCSPRGKPLGSVLDVVHFGRQTVIMCNVLDE